MSFLLRCGLLLGTLAGLAPAPALAQVSCGDTVGPGETVVLTADVGPCTAATDPALDVVGPATLDLAGHRVLCDASSRPTGIRVLGKGAKVLHGGADSCAVGIEITGEGKHKVEDFVATGNTTEGFSVDSDKNKVKRGAAVENGSDGFDVEGDGNKIEDAEAVGNVEDGFRGDGDANSFKRIASSGNGGDAVRMDGDDNKIKDCRATTSGEDGVEINGAGNKVEKCLASANSPTDAGFDIDGSSNQITKNLALGNAIGISVDGGASGNVVKQNIALGSAIFDLNDGNAGCGGNTWQKNRFGTSDADGVPSPPCIE